MLRSPFPALLAKLALARVMLAPLFLAPSIAFAVDLGAIGPVYPIAEPNLLDFIRQRLLAKERSGELVTLQESARRRGIEAMTHPQPVAGLRTAETARTFYFDPTFTLDRNVQDDKGRLLFPAGTRKNPLEIVSLSKRLLFFDARDQRQVARAREVIALYQGHVKPILVGGSYLDLMKSWRSPVYYDQQGLLTRRFGITQVPAIVSQEGLRLRIDELVLP